MSMIHSINKILLIDLGNIKDAHIIKNLSDSIMNKNPQASISVLADKRIEDQVTSIEGLTFHGINYENIVSIISNSSLGDGFALNEFINPVQSVKEQVWDCVVNIGNDYASIALASYIRGKKNFGISFNQDKSKRYSNYWSKIYDHLSSIHYDIGLSPIEILHHMLNLDWGSSTNQPYLLPTVESKSIDKKMIEIQKEYFKSSHIGKTVGVLMSPHDNDKTIPFNALYGFFDMCYEKNDILPLFLIPQGGGQRSIITYNNNNIIEYEDKYLPNLLNHIDIAITFFSPRAMPVSKINTSSLRVFPLHSDPAVEVFPLEDSLVMRCVRSDYSLLQASDILTGCLSLLSEDKKSYQFSNNVVVYRPFKKDNYSSYIPIGGDVNIYDELVKIIAKNLIYIYADDGDILLTPHFYKNIFYKDEIDLFIEKEKEYLNQAIKRILRCIRLVKKLKLRKDQGSSFIGALESLVNLCSLKSIVAVPIMIFKIEVEAIASHDCQTNIAIFEESLFSLKKRVHKIYKLINTFNEKNSVLRNFL